MEKIRECKECGINKIENECAKACSTCLFSVNKQPPLPPLPYPINELYIGCNPNLAEDFQIIAKTINSLLDWAKEIEKRVK